MPPKVKAPSTRKPRRVRAPGVRKQRKHLQYDLWFGKIDKTKSGKTRADVLRIPVPGGGFKYVWKSRHDHGKAMYEKSKSILERYQFK